MSHDGGVGGGRRRGRLHGLHKVMSGLAGRVPVVSPPTPGTDLPRGGASPAPRVPLSVLMMLLLLLLLLERLPVGKILSVMRLLLLLLNVRQIPRREDAVDWPPASSSGHVAPRGVWMEGHPHCSRNGSRPVDPRYEHYVLRLGRSGGGGDRREWRRGEHVKRGRHDCTAASAAVLPRPSSSSSPTVMMVELLLLLWLLLVDDELSAPPGNQHH